MTHSRKLVSQVPVSAVIPVRDGALFIADALQSIFDQTSVPREIIVIDDGSTDDTAAVVRRFDGVTYVRQPALGLSAARNHGIRLASSPYLAFLDADDLWTPNKTKLQLATLSTNPGIDAVAGHMVQFRHSEAGTRKPLGAISAANLPGLMIIKREAFFRVGYYDPAVRLGEAIEWWARALDRGLRSEIVPEIVLWRRIHGRNIGLVTANPMQSYLGVLHSIVNRRRREQ